MKITTEQCKQLIVKFCADNKDYINRQFTENLSEEIYSKVLEPRNWRRRSKGMDYSGRGIERSFDCRPLDDQLRAYVITDVTDEKVLGLTVQGE